MLVSVLGVDPAKNSSSTVGLDDGGHVVVRRRMIGMVWARSHRKCHPA